MALQAKCPGCAADLTFDVPGAVAKVCAYCHSIVSRGAGALENLGKVADIRDSQSPLQEMLEGSHEGKKFTLTGRTLLRHAAGGSWEEWYAAFDDGRWGWLAEAQGKFTLMFERAGAKPPPEDALAPGREVKVGGELLTVAEIGEAAYAGARGELPFRLDPRERMRYADLSGADRRVATLDYSDGKVYVGREVTLGELGLAGRAAAERPAARVAAERVACPECDGTLELRAPDAAERVGCPYCGALLDVNQGKLTVFKALYGAKVTPDLPLGAAGELEGKRYTIIGFLRRSIELEGERFPWDEYLLAGPESTYRWLVVSDGNWSFVTPVPAGDVSERAGFASFGGKDYKQEETGPARVDYVLGEMTWKVEVGETVQCTDFVDPPESLSQELSQASADGMQAAEVSWSHAKYVPAETVAAAFAQTLAPPRAPGMLTPSPYRGLIDVALLAFGALLVVAMVLVAIRPRREVHTEAFDLAALPTAEATQVAFSAPFHLEANQGVTIRVSTSSVDQNWLYVSGDLVQPDTGLLVEWDAELGYWHGTDDGEAWSEGSRGETEHLGAVPAGTYEVRVEATWPDFASPKRVEIQITQGGFRVPHFLVAGGALAAAMLLLAWLAGRFEKLRRGEL